MAARLEAVRKELESLKRTIADEKKSPKLAFKWEDEGRPSTTQFHFQQRRTLRGHFGKIYALDWAKEDNTLLSASNDGKLIIWNAYLELKKQVISLKSAWVMSCAFDKETGRFVACGGLDNICSIYEVAPSGPAGSGAAAPVGLPTELVGHDGYLSSCRFLGGGKILTSSGDSSCALWDIGKQVKLQTFADHSADVMSVSLHPTDKNLFASGSCDATVKVWDMRANACVKTLEGHRSDINAVDFFPSGNCVGTGSDDATCKIFDLRGYGAAHNFAEDSITHGVTDVAFSATGKLLFASYDEPVCRAWETISKDGTYHELNGHKNRVSCLGVNSTGQALCTGSWDMELAVWA